MSGEGGGCLPFWVRSKAAAQGVTCGWACCHNAEPRNCCTTLQDVCVGRFPSAASEHLKRVFHPRSVLVEQIPYALCLPRQKNK
jgi:hypothetical protein